MEYFLKSEEDLPSEFILLHELDATFNQIELKDDEKVYCKLKDRHLVIYQGNCQIGYFLTRFSFTMAMANVIDKKDTRFLILLQKDGEIDRITMIQMVKDRRP